MKKPSQKTKKTIFYFEDSAFKGFNLKSLQRAWPKLPKRPFVGENDFEKVPELIQLSLAYLLCRCGYVNFSLSQQKKSMVVVLEVAGES